MKTLALMLVLATHGADAYYTNNVIQRGGREADPLARPFVHGQAWLATSMALNTAGILAGAHLLRKHHHNKLALALELGDAAGHGVSAGQTAHASYNKP